MPVLDSQGNIMQPRYSVKLRRAEAGTVTVSPQSGEEWVPYNSSVEAFGPVLTRAGQWQQWGCLPQLSSFFASPGPLAKVPMNPGEDTAVPSPFPGSVSDLMKVACGTWLPPVPADPGIGPPGVHILLAGSHLRGTALWVSRWSAGLCDSAGNKCVLSQHQ